MSKFLKFSRFFIFFISSVNKNISFNKAAVKALIFIVLTLNLSTSAYASNPKSIEHIKDVVLGEEIYGHYVVLCSSGKKAIVSSWDNKELWCIGDGMKDECVKRQLKIAKISCRGA